MKRIIFFLIFIILIISCNNNKKDNELILLNKKIKVNKNAKSYFDRSDYYYEIMKIAKGDKSNQIRLLDWSYYSNFILYDFDGLNMLDVERYLQTNPKRIKTKIFTE